MLLYLEEHGSHSAVVKRQGHALDARVSLLAQVHRRLQEHNILILATIHVHKKLLKHLNTSV